MKMKEWLVEDCDTYLVGTLRELLQGGSYPSALEVKVLRNRRIVEGKEDNYKRHAIEVTKEFDSGKRYTLTYNLHEWEHILELINEAIQKLEKEYQSKPTIRYHTYIM